MGKEAQKRLEATRDELADRAGRQKQYAPTEAVKKLKDQLHIWAICPNMVKPPADCDAYDELRLAGVHGDLNEAGTVYLLAAKASEVNTNGCALRRRTDGDVDKWISSDTACIWIANHDHKPDPAWGERFIELKANNRVVMTTRETGSWEG